MKSKTVMEIFEDSSLLILESGRQNFKAIEKIAHTIISCFNKGGKLLIFGNGGSASQAQHFAAELVNKFFTYRKALPAIALTADTSNLTSIGNDLDFSEIFSRQIEALGKKKDIAWGLSTSGRSPNVLKAFKAAKKAGLLTISFTGGERTELSMLSDIALTVPSKNTARIQEVHLCSGHSVCELVEAHFLNKICIHRR
ncbi:MAG: SIS domain-containing protein [Pseudomonadota bacterium]